MRGVNKRDKEHDFNIQPLTVVIRFTDSNHFLEDLPSLLRGIHDPGFLTYSESAQHAQLCLLKPGLFAQHVSARKTHATPRATPNGQRECVRRRTCLPGHTVGPWINEPWTV